MARLLLNFAPIPPDGGVKFARVGVQGSSAAIYTGASRISMLESMVNRMRNGGIFYGIFYAKTNQTI
jgi:hypothetical protein